MISCRFFEGRLGPSAESESQKDSSSCSLRTVRLPAGERRAALLSTACAAFSEGSYRGTTTAEIARAAGITEPILYRHFESKRELFLACLEETWGGLRMMWDEAIAAFRQAITLKPNYAEAYSNLGIVLYDKGQLDEAIAAYRKGVKGPLAVPDSQPVTSWNIASWEIS